MGAASLLVIVGLFGIPGVLSAGFFPLLLTWWSGTSEDTSLSGSYTTYVERMDGVVLRAARNLDPNPAKGGGGPTIEGGVALRAEGGPTGTEANFVDQKSSDQISLYVVKEGDSLSGIAKMFDVSVNTIAWANDIQGGRIKIGQLLTILPITGVRHTVAKGDTLASIAKKYKGDLEEILLYNNFATETSLSVGSIVVIPDGVMGTTRVVVATSGSSGVPSYSGYYTRPIVGGRRTQGVHGYNGVDIAAPVGTPVVASADGTVIVSMTGGWNGGYGNYIVVRHGNGTQTLYAHNRSNIVGVGQYVTQGQVIGYVGSTGRSTGPHVHFEVRGAVNPF